MNTTNATNATPTPAAPLTPEPPKCCPACNAKQTPKSNDIDTWYECSQLYQLVDGVWKRNSEWDCRNAFSAAASLRALLNESERISRDIHADNEKLRAERDAALARLAELKRIGSMLANFAYNVSQDEKVSEHYRVQLKEMQTDWDAALASGAESEVTK